MTRMQPDLTRRHFVAGTGLAAAVLPLVLNPSARALAQSNGTLNLADIGVGNPGGDWSRFSGGTGWDVNLVAIGDAPSALMNLLMAGGGTETYELLHVVGGVQPPLVENGLIEEIDTARIPNWSKDAYIQDYMAEGKPGHRMVAYNGKIYGVPTIIQGDSFGYLSDVTGPLDSYGALFDPKWRGFVALDNNPLTSGHKTAQYLKYHKLATIEDPYNMTPAEIKTVVDFLVDKKKEGQFRVLWTGYQQAVDLFSNREVYVMDCWEPVVIGANAKGAQAVYATPIEGYMLWSMSAYLTKNPNRAPERTQAAYDLLNFMLGGWYGATITSLYGYMTNSQAVPFAENHASDFPAGTSERVNEVDSNVKRKLKHGGLWQRRWPDNLEILEDEWARLRAA